MGRAVEMMFALTATLAAASTTSRRCHLDPETYPSVWNETALRVCTGSPRPERVCVVGGGFAGVHMAWLLKRRLFTNITVFEASSRTGGDAWTRVPVPDPSGKDTITRELGAAFLSPDYDEVRALLSRFGHKELPLSTTTQLEFHVRQGPQETVQHAAEWANERVSRYTHTTNATANGLAVAAALGRYVELHRFIFVSSSASRPPREPPQNCSAASSPWPFGGTLSHPLRSRVGLSLSRRARTPDDFLQNLPPQTASRC